MTKEEGLKKLKKYCDYQERCHQDVRNKLLSLKIFGQNLEEIIAELIQEDYLNEVRYASSYVRGKYKLKKWGRKKIEIELKRRRISEYCIRKGLAEIDEEQYLNNLKMTLEKYQNERSHRFDSPELKYKTINHLLSKGYEYELIIAAFNNSST